MTDPVWELSAEAAFLDTMEDLRRRSDLRASRYEMVQSAGLVRRLLLEANPLLHEVNRKHRLKIEFAVGYSFVFSNTERASLLWTGPWLDSVFNREQREYAIAQIEANGHDSSLLRNHPYPEPVKLDRFLALPVIRESCRLPVKEREITVHRLIDFYAHELGGVHYGLKQDPRSLLSDVMPDGEQYLRETMIAIGRVVYRSLEPLATRILLLSRPHPFGLPKLS